MKRLLISTMAVVTLTVTGINMGDGFFTVASAKEPASLDTLLLGSAVFSDKSNHAGITVTLSGNGVKQTTKTDTGGTFSFSEIPPGTDYQLEAISGANYLAARRYDVVIKPNGMSRAKTLALMARPGTVTGTVTLEGDSSRVGFIFEDLATGARLMQTNPALNGTFTFRGVPAGKRIIRLFKPGFESRQILVDIPANGEVSLGQVELSSHVGNLDATFTLDGASVHNDIWIILEDNANSLYYSGKTDTTGRVRIEGIRAGIYRLLAKKANSEELIIDSVAITDGATTTLPNKTYTTTTLTKLKGSISGEVQLYTISAYNGGNIIYKKTPCYGCFVVTQGGIMTISDKNGRFLLSGIPKGDYSLDVSYETCITAQHDSYSTPSFSITATSSAYNFRSPIPMLESTGTIIGVARLEGQTVHSNIIVSVEGLTGYFTTTDAHGNYKLSSVPVRNKPMTVIYSKANYAPVSLEDVYASKDHQVNTLPNVKLALSAK
jgi:hypothetical protein